MPPPTFGVAGNPVLYGVALCSVASRFCHVTVSPSVACTFCGTNAVFCIFTSRGTAAAGAATTDGRRTMRAATRLMERLYACPESGRNRSYPLWVVPAFRLDAAYSPTADQP